jgi:hypothetical protein
VNVQRGCHFRQEKVPRATIAPAGFVQRTSELDDEVKFKLQNSAFIQFDRQMSANMACALLSHHKKMSV